VYSDLITALNYNADRQADLALLDITAAFENVDHTHTHPLATIIWNIWLRAGMVHILPGCQVSRSAVFTHLHQEQIIGHVGKLN